MPVRVKNRSFYTGSAIPNNEITILQLPSESEIYFVGGYLDLTNLESGDTLLVTEYIEFDSTFKVFNNEAYSDSQSIPIVRIPTRKLKSGYKITLNQISGSIQSISYQFDKFITELA